MKQILISLFAIFVLTACADHKSPSIEGQWRLVSYGPPGSASNQILADPEIETSIEFDSDGRMSGNVGCNGFGGDYTVKGNQIEFGPVMSTMMFCEGPAGEQERWALAVFQESATFEIDGNKVTITAPDGFWSIVLERK